MQDIERKEAFNFTAKIRLAIVAMSLALGGIFCKWLLRTESITLVAMPGETIERVIPYTYVTYGVWVGDKEMSVEYGEVRDGSYLCKNNRILVGGTASSLPVYSYLQNNCTEKVTVEIWWFDEFKYLNVLDDFLSP